MAELQATRPCLEEGCPEARHNGTPRCRPHQTAFVRGRKIETRSVRRTRMAIYGMTLEQYDAMFAAQGGRCAVCRRESTTERLQVDHDHETGVVRALLCGPCNRGLGQFRDDPGVLRAAAYYLERFAANRPLGT